MFQKNCLVLLLVELIGQSEAGGKYFDDLCYIRSNDTEKYKIELRNDSWTYINYILYIIVNIIKLIYLGLNA